MCGIAGFVTRSPGTGSEAILRRMTDRIRHRGPNDSGFYTDSHAFLGHRRLSIVDVAGGHQPIANESRSLWIVYNGEIFNHASVRPELERAGHEYATRSDTETVLHAYEQYGPDCLARFRGMFSFALWDAASRTLFCARDRLGIKPLYYFCDGNTFAFASEIKALLVHPDVSTEFDESVLAEYLAFGYISDERTFFRGIRKLAPGHHLTLALAVPDGALNKLSPRIEQYWEVPRPGENRQEGNCRSEQDWIRETRRRLEEVVEMRLMSEVPLGVFLSGGIDSAAIAAITGKISSGDLKTFSVGYREQRYSELSAAAETAAALGTQHHEIVIGMDDFFGALPDLIWHEDEPPTWPSSVSLYFVSRLASEHVTVVLTGEGSDEMFGGYERYRWNAINQAAARWYRFVPGPIRSLVRNSVHRLPADLARKAEHTVFGREISLESLYLDNFYCAFSGADLATFLNGQTRDCYASYRARWDSRPDASPLARMLFADHKTYLVELLMKQDQASMASSIESRVPFLDHHFFEFAMSMPDHLKIRGKIQKYALRRAVEGILPAEIIGRKKLGFPTPMRDWLRQADAKPLLRNLESPGSFLVEHVNQGNLRELIEAHASLKIDATDRLWRLLTLQIWADVFLTGKRERWEAIFPSTRPVGVVF